MIRVVNVHKRFGSQVVLRDVSLTIKDGEMLAVVGPSGVGKSVLLKLIMGIMSPEAGQIYIDDDNIVEAHSEADKNRIRERLGVLFQSAALFDSLTVYENVAFPLKERGGFASREIHRRVIDMLEALSLGPVAAMLPQEISIGVRKRVGMARSLITEPRVLLIDEPNTGLDPLVGKEVYDLISDCRKRWGFTGVVISHEIPEVFQVVDRVAMLLNGALVEEGTPEQLQNSAHPAVHQFLTGSRNGPIQIH